jgi:8-oxo-dGTP pyrophosphatase MutT (NUDIX family)
MGQAIPTWTIVMVVIRSEDRYVLVEERDDMGWYLAAGRVHPGETLQDAARREVEEEAAIRIELDAIHQIQHTPSPSGACRLRVIFVAHSLDGEAVKQRPDRHSVSSRWFTLQQARGLRVRHPEVLTILEAVDSGIGRHPLSLLSHE